ncbi:uncharacterized protein TNCV_1495021 [Trichonephila clavipes]|nr:uncharacterized protein TNCV_1495021 [Trichonephila clavipes]
MFCITVEVFRFTNHYFITKVTVPYVNISPVSEGLVHRIPTTQVRGSNDGLGKGCGSPVVRVSDHGRYVMSSSPVPLKTRCVGQRCTLNLSRAEMSSRWCVVVVRRGGASSGVVHVT